MKEHWRLKGGVARVSPVVNELVAEGRLRRLRVSDGGADVLVAADASGLRRRHEPPSPHPFDNLLWDRPFARRILGFEHLIEVYKPAPQRRYGYYVLVPPRRSHRRPCRSQVGTAGRPPGRARLPHEDGVRASGALDDALDRALHRLARSIGLEEVKR